jgi:hypothetical protein
MAAKLNYDSQPITLDTDVAYHRQTIAWSKDDDGSISIKWSGLFHVLNATAATIWEAIDGTKTTDEVISHFVQTYQSIEPRTEFLRECAEETLFMLLERGLISKPDSVWSEDWDSLG